MNKIIRTYPIECETCQGEGKVPDMSTMGQYQSKKRPCKACKGTGVITLKEVTEPIIYEVRGDMIPINIDKITIPKKNGKNKNKK